MSLNYEELYFGPTAIGDLMLRRRRMPQFGSRDIYEVKLGEDFLMTSLFHEAEDQLAHLGLKAVDGDSLNVVVGGLGLGYTAVEALKDKRIASLVVVDFLSEIIEWHNSGLVPMGPILTSDHRCTFHHGDFFAMAKKDSSGFVPDSPHKKLDAVLLDIDHTPKNLLDPGNGYFYTLDGLTEFSTHLRPGGVFALWTDGVADDSFTEHLSKVFANARGHTIEFDNPLHGGKSTGAVYVANRPSE